MKGSVDKSVWKGVRLLGYPEYRRGIKKPVSLAGQRTKPKPIWTGAKRQYQVDAAMDILRDWRLSPFEFEGSVRAGIRSALCLAGHNWERADTTAADIVSEALRRLGAKRPTYEQGQKEYVEPRENCRNCGGLLDDQDVADRNSFCSSECKIAMRTFRHDRYRYYLDKAYKHAHYKAEMASAPERDCAHCGKQFRSARADRFCSKKCSGLAKTFIHPKPCEICGTTFKPTHPGTRFCSMECLAVHRSKVKVVGSCMVCDTPFLARTENAMYCSVACGQRAYKINQGRLKNVSPTVLDYLFRKQGLRITCEAA